MAPLLITWSVVDGCERQTHSVYSELCATGFRVVKIMDKDVRFPTNSEEALSLLVRRVIITHKITSYMAPIANTICVRLPCNIMPKYVVPGTASPPIAWCCHLANLMV